MTLVPTDLVYACPNCAAPGVDLLVTEFDPYGGTRFKCTVCNFTVSEIELRLAARTRKRAAQSHD